jgi:hypothetical protein
MSGWASFAKLIGEGSLQDGCLHASIEASSAGQCTAIWRGIGLLDDHAIPRIHENEVAIVILAEDGSPNFQDSSLNEPTVPELRYRDRVGAAGGHCCCKQLRRVARWQQETQNDA